MHNSMSLYDQQFNRRHSVGSRKWDRHRLAWLPEASDNPLQGAAACSKPSLSTSYVTMPTLCLGGRMPGKGVVFLISCTNFIRWKHQLWSERRGGAEMEALEGAWVTWRFFNHIRSLFQVRKQFSACLYSVTVFYVTLQSRIMVGKEFKYFGLVKNSNILVLHSLLDDSMDPE